MKLLPIWLAEPSISIPDALLISLVGFLTVFAVLVLLIIVIKLLAGVTSLFSRKAAVPAGPEPLPAAAAPVAARAVPASGGVPAPGSIGECDLHTVDDKTAALLMAIVADDLKAPLNELRFISIREI